MQAKLDEIILQLGLLAGRIERIEARLDGVKSESSSATTGNGARNDASVRSGKSSTPVDNSRALISREQQTQMVTAAADIAYDQIMAELNENVFPEMNKLAQMVHYQAQDSDGLVDSYRRAVESREFGNLLTDGKEDRRVISPHVRLFY